MTSSVGSWNLPPSELRLLNGEIHAWRVGLQSASSHSDHFLTFLTEDERDRADRFHFVRDRDRFVMARGVLRSILGGYLNVSPAKLRFSYSAYGKPDLTREFGGDRIRFNASSSHELAIFAVGVSIDIGVDVEWTGRQIDFSSIAEHFFSHAEQAALRSLPADMQRDAFYRCWTRKEAYIKARGEGLSIPLDHFEVSLSSDEPARLVRAEWDPLEASRWSLTDLNPETGYLSAVALSGHDWQLRTWHWQSEAERR